VQYNIISERIGEGCIDDSTGGFVADTVEVIEALILE